MSGINSQPIPEQNLQYNTLFDSQLSTRCIFMLLLTCTALEIIEQIRFGEYKTGNMNVIFQNMIKYSILQENNENNTINKERMQYNCAWIYDERAKEIIKISILLSRYSNIANICILQLQTWLKDHSLLKLSIKKNSLIYLRDSLQRKLSEQFTPPSNTSIINSATTSASASNKAVDEEEEYVFNPHFALKPITSGTIILEDIQDSLFLLWVLALKINADQALYDISLLIKWISHPEGEQLDSEENYGNIHMIAYCI